MMFDDKPAIENPDVAYLVGTSQGSIAGYEKQFNEDVAKWVKLVGVEDVHKAVQFYRLKAKSGWLDINLLTQCVTEVMAEGYPTVGDAWASVMRASRNSKKPKLDPIIMATISALGGWKTFVDSKNLISERSNFYKHYETILNKKIRENYVAS